MILTVLHGQRNGVQCSKLIKTVPTTELERCSGTLQGNQQNENITRSHRKVSCHSRIGNYTAIKVFGKMYTYDGRMLVEYPIRVKTEKEGKLGGRTIRYYTMIIHNNDMKQFISSI